MILTPEIKTSITKSVLCWLATTVPFEDFRFIFRRNEHGWWWAHAYRYEDGFMHTGEAPGHGVEIDEALELSVLIVNARVPIRTATFGRTLNALIRPHRMTTYVSRAHFGCPPYGWLCFHYSSYILHVLSKLIFVPSLFFGIVN